MGLYDTFNFGEYPKEKFAKILGLKKILNKISLNTLYSSEYQTKDLDKTFNGYFFLKKLKTNYALFHHEITYAWKEPETKKQNDNDFFFDVGYMEEVSSEDIRQTKTQTINVYELHKFDDERIWVEFQMEFVKGLLKSIKLLEPEITVITEEEKKRNFELEVMMAKSARYSYSPLGKIHHNLSKKYYRSPISKLQRFIGKTISKIGSSIQNFRPL